MNTEETTLINDEKYGIKECDLMQAFFRAFLFERPGFISCWLPDLHIGCPTDSVLDVNSAYKLGGVGTNLQGKLHGNLVGVISVRSACLCNMNDTIPLDGFTGVVPNLTAITFKPISEQTRKCQLHIARAKNLPKVNAT